MKAPFTLILIILEIFIAPFIFLYSINSLAELGGVSYYFYIPHTPFSYFVSILFIATVRGK